MESKRASDQWTEFWMRDCDVLQRLALWHCSSLKDNSTCTDCRVCLFVLMSQYLVIPLTLKHVSPSHFFPPLPLLSIIPPPPSHPALSSRFFSLSFPSLSHLLLFPLSFNTRKTVTMAPRRESCRSISLPPGIEWCLCVVVMHHSRRPLSCRPTQRFTWSDCVDRLSPIFHSLFQSSDTADTFN